MKLRDPAPYQMLRQALPPTPFGAESCQVLKVHPEAWRILALAQARERGQTWSGGGLGDEPQRLSQYVDHCASCIARFTNQKMKREQEKAKKQASTLERNASVGRRFR